MITIRLKGGLGNQMFQYAFAKAISHSLKTSFQMDCSLLLDRARGNNVVYRDYDLDIFNVQKNFSSSPSFLRFCYKIPSSKVGKFIRGRVLSDKEYVKESYFHTDQSIIEKPLNDALYDGWWQSPKYFSQVSKEIRTDFAFAYPLMESSLPLYEMIRETNSVCLNVRRTDFVANATLNTTNAKYFYEAANHMASLVHNPMFFVFSDDVAWCRENITLDFPMQIVDHDMKGYKFSNYMRLMHACHHFIIPNSSFAWWATWLNDEVGKKVIAPRIWFNDASIDTSDLIPQNWLRL